MAQASTQLTYKSPLHEMTQSTPTCLWNDSASIQELRYSIEHGAVGATCNPVIVHGVLKKEMPVWKDRIRAVIEERSTATEDEIGWQLVREVSMKGAALLKPIFDSQGGRNGRLSIQTDPRLYRNSAAIVEQAEEFNRLAPNMIVKIPVTRAGIPAIEEATYRGISINATVCFTLPQCVAVAEAVERGLKRRERDGKDISTMGPVCTIMVGRLDDWLKVLTEKENITIDPGYLEWAGIAVFKKTYQLFRTRGYRIRLLSAAFRNHMHWSEFIGGDVVISPPYSWQVRFNASDVEVRNRINEPVDPKIVEDLSRKFADFRRASTEGGIAIEEFDSFGATRRTLRQFVAACGDLDSLVRDFLLPNQPGHGLDSKPDRTDSTQASRPAGDNPVCSPSVGEDLVDAECHFPAHESFWQAQLSGEALPAGDGPDDDERLLPGRDGVGERSVGRFVGEILFAGEEAQERPALLRDLVADGAAQHRIPGLESIKHRALRNRAFDVELHFVADVRQRPKVLRDGDSNHIELRDAARPFSGQPRRRAGDQSPSDARKDQPRAPIAIRAPPPPGRPPLRPPPALG